MNIRVVSLFSGGGGLDLGFKRAGYDIIWAIDNNKDAVGNYRHNISDDIICGDITKLDIADIPDCDVIIGGPPCQSFSLAGNRNCDDARGRLVWKYLDIIESKQPKAFLFENVSGLMSAKDSNGKKILDSLLAAFSEIGYNLSWKLINAADYGVPQIRKRVIIVGMKNGSFTFPEATHNPDGTGGKEKYVSVETAIGDLPPASPDSGFDNHEMPQMSELDRFIVRHVKPGGNYMDIPDDVKSVRIQRLKRDGGHTTCYGRMAADRPSYTINTYFNRPNVGCNIHYSHDRLITIREAMRIQTFPDDYHLVGSSKQGKHTVIGNAVPPLLSYKLAVQLSDQLTTPSKSMKTNWINNTDKEVEHFHPVCREALEQALRELGMDRDYHVQHHRTVDSLEMDLVIAGIQTDSILCVIEVKRTISAVYSSRYQYQAMSYVQALSDSVKESPYYILTNLECSALFRYDKNRPQVYQQLIEPGIEMNHRFTDVDRETFMSDLTAQYARYIKAVKEDSGIYMDSYQNIAVEIAGTLHSQDAYNMAMATFAYEYIRGAFKRIKRENLTSVSVLSRKIRLICAAGSKINFRDIFNPAYFPANQTVSYDPGLMKEVRNLGERQVDADAVTDVLHSVISNGQEHEGEVATDIELALTIMHLIKHFGGDLKEGEKIMDPAAGSGSLLAAAANVFENLQPSQMIANDINVKFRQLLSLRLGLKFPKIVCKGNTPDIYASNITGLSPDLFDDVKYIVMNPPFLSATAASSTQRRNELYSRIEELSGAKALTQCGQAPLEAPFLELVTNLAKEGTVIACILPQTHLKSKGKASAAIRRLLLEKFGLRLIFNYPASDLFDKVVQNTAVMIGVCGKPASTVRYLYSNDIISDIDPDNLPAVLNSRFDTEEISPLPENFEGREAPYTELHSSIDNGWEIFNISKQEGRRFINDNYRTCPKLQLCESGRYAGFYRGAIGNGGASDLLYYSKKPDFADYLKNTANVPAYAGMRNAKSDSMTVGLGQSLFLNTENLTRTEIESIIEIFQDKFEKLTSKQQKHQKTAKEYYDIMIRESRHKTKANSVLAPRGIRGKARVYLCDRQTFVSTNFFIFETDSLLEAKVLSSWMSTCFYQLECETVSKNQSGERKMEKTEFGMTHLPDFNALDDDEKIRIENEMDNPQEFIDLRDPQPRDIDRIWAEILFGEQAEEKLDEAFFILGVLAANREI